MKNLGIIIFITTNIYLSYYYIRDIVAYFTNSYHYDGFRYFMPYLISDTLLLFAIIMIYRLLGFCKYFIYYLVLALAHNVTVGLGVELIPFVGIVVVIISIIDNVFIIRKLHL